MRRNVLRSRAMRGAMRSVRILKKKMFVFCRIARTVRRRISYSVVSTGVIRDYLCREDFSAYLKIIINRSFSDIGPLKLVCLQPQLTFQSTRDIIELFCLLIFFSNPSFTAASDII